jgi:hypothetical protein
MYPRTDLANFISWDSFETEIHQAITTRMTAMNIASEEYDIGSMPKKRKIVSSEEGVRCQAEVQLHDLVEEVLNILGIDGRFERPDSGNNQIVGEPDFFLVAEFQPAPKGCGAYVTDFCSLTALILWYRLSTRQNGRHPLKTCLGIFNAIIVATSRSDSRSTLCTNSTAI